MSAATPFPYLIVVGGNGVAWHAAARQAAVGVAEQVRERDNRRRTRSQRCGQGAGGAAMAAMPRTRWTKLTRRLGLDGNPLRPRSDLMQRWLLPAAIGLFVALCPVVAGLTGMWVRADNAAVAHAKLEWHSVTAVLLRAVPGPAESDHGANTWMTWTPARWTVDGQQHAGDVPAAAKSSAGSRETVWLNQAGQPQMPPLTAGQVGDRAAADTLMALAALAAVLTGLCWLARRALYRRRLEGWEIEWLTVGPLWSRQG